MSLARTVQHQHTEGAEKSQGVVMGGGLTWGREPAIQRSDYAFWNCTLETYTFY